MKNGVLFGLVGVDKTLFLYILCCDIYNSEIFVDMLLSSHLSKQGDFLI